MLTNTTMFIFSIFSNKFATGYSQGFHTFKPVNTFSSWERFIEILTW